MIACALVSDWVLSLNFLQVASVFHGFAKSVIPGFIAWKLLESKTHFQSSSLVGAPGEDRLKKDAPLVEILSLEDVIRYYASTSQRLVVLITARTYLPSLSPVRVLIVFEFLSSEIPCKDGYRTDTTCAQFCPSQQAGAVQEKSQKKQHRFFQRWGMRGGRGVE